MITGDSKLHKIAAVEVFNLNTTAMFCGEYVPKGCLGITLINPSIKHVYTKTKNVYWSCCGGIVSAYEFKNGTTRGFAGREITLPVIGTGKVFKNLGVTKLTFKGSLWDTGTAIDIASKEIGEPLVNIGIGRTTDKTYCSYLATKSFLDRVARVVHLGIPEQSPLL